MDIEEAKKLAEQLIEEHLPVGWSGWNFKFDNAVRKFGHCDLDTFTISLSRPLTLLNDVEKVRDVILHEIAHALAGPLHGHDGYWRKIALSIGCNGKRCYSEENTITPQRKWVGKCPACSKRVLKHRRVRIACSRCCDKHNNGKFHVKFEFKWSENNAKVQP